MKFQLLRNLLDVRAKRVGVVRLALLFVPFAAVMAVVALGMAKLYVGGTAKFLKEAQSNMVCQIPLPPVRGDIVDRNGVVLAKDNAGFRVLRIGRNCNWDDITPGGSKINMATSKYAALAEWQRDAISARRFIEISRFIESREESPEKFVQTVPARIYPRGEAVSHIVGYLGEIDESEIRMFRHRGYGLGDRVGKGGVERTYETALNGMRGRREIIIDAAGRFMTERRTVPQQRGETLRLTIDVRLQQAAYDALKNSNKKGAVVFMNPHNGEILALVTYPSFSPAPGPDGLTPINWPRLAMDPDHPLVNRAISSFLPLGSVFKLVVATGSLEEGVATPQSSFFCPGFYSLPGRRSYPPRCYTSHGSIGFVNGISQSCDVVFYILGQKLGVTKINYYAKMMGLGSKTGIDLSGESVGLIPDEDWKRRFGGGGEWSAGDTINISIGQGNMMITPIQVARMVSIFANGGWLVSPHVAQRGDWPMRKLQFKPENVEAVRQGMRGAVLTGTCRRISDFPYAVAAKTGTAQTGTRTEPKKSHSWFAGFAPFDNPVVSFAVYVEHGGYGAEAALPVAREVLDKALELGYFKNSTPQAALISGGN